MDLVDFMLLKLGIFAGLCFVVGVLKGWYRR